MADYTTIKNQPTSVEILEKLKQENRPVLLSFSCGKDSIGAWIALEQAGIEVIPVYMYLDYDIWGRSFDGLDYRFTEPMSRALPEDYKLLCEWFPLIPLDIERHEYYDF